MQLRHITRFRSTKIKEAKKKQLQNAFQFLLFVTTDFVVFIAHWRNGNGGSGGNGANGDGRWVVLSWWRAFTLQMVKKTEKKIVYNQLLYGIVRMKRCCSTELLHIILRILEISLKRQTYPHFLHFIFSSFVLLLKPL